MAKIPLTIDPTYCASWGVWEGIRELIANAKDAEDYDSKPMTIKHSKRTSVLSIATEGVSVPAADLLLLGRSSKGDGGQRGRFGEGFVLGVLALVRKGHEVTIYNGDEVWRPGVETADETHPLAGAPLLTFVTRKLQGRRTAFTVEVEDVPEAVWEVIRKLFLFLAAPPAASVISLARGTVLTSEEYKGKVYARGVFVRELPDLECGYNLPEVELDRDRRMVDEWRLQWSLAALWQEASKTAAYVPRIYELAKMGAKEVKQLAYHTDSNLLSALRAEFAKENGDDAVPTTSAAEVKEIEEAGARPVIVDETLRELLAKSGLAAKEVTSRAAGTVEKTWTWSDLTAAEQSAWNLYGAVVVGSRSAVYVTFRGDVMCQPLPAGDGIAVDRRLLSKPPRALVAAVADGEAKRRGTSALDVLLDSMVGREETSTKVETSPSEEIPL